MLTSDSWIERILKHVWSQQNLAKCIQELAMSVVLVLAWIQNLLKIYCSNSLKCEYMMKEEWKQRQHTVSRWQANLLVYWGRLMPLLSYKSTLWLKLSLKYTAAMRPLLKPLLKMFWNKLSRNNCPEIIQHSGWHVLPVNKCAQLVYIVPHDAEFCSAILFSRTNNVLLIWVQFLIKLLVKFIFPGRPRFRILTNTDAVFVVVVVDWRHPGLWNSYPDKNLL